MLNSLRGALAAICLLSLFPAGASAAELIMTNQRSCSYCAKFERELGNVYDQTEAGRIAPLRRVSALKKWPADLAGVTPARATPIFIVVEDGREVGRFAGYVGEEGFWRRLKPILAKL